jgi:hypothetical protein
VRLALYCLALGAFPVFGQVAGIAVYTSFQNPPSSVALTSFERELDSIVSPIGLDIIWRSVDSTDRVVANRHLIVTKFTGLCDAHGLPIGAFRHGTLGRTHMTDGKILPFVDIDCDHIRGFVRSSLMPLSAAERNEVMGRAMARVFAHELYHVLGQTSHHGSAPVDRSTYTATDLTEPKLPSSDKCRLLEVQDQTPPARASRRRGKIKFFEKLCSICHGPSGEGTKKAPPIRTAKPVDAALLAVRLGIDGGAMCRSADKLKLEHPVLGKQDIDDLVRYLNAPPF